MTMRLHEIHPMLVHAPLVLMPTAIFTDLLGATTGNKRLLSIGKQTTVLAAGSALLAGAFGFVAEQEVNLNDHTSQMLDTHRNINVAVASLTTAMSIYRFGRDRPGPLYLTTSFGALAAVSYSAYLGAKMVYHHGVGVEASDGVDIDKSIEIRPDTFGDAVMAAGKHFAGGVQRLFHDWFGRGGIVPTSEDFEEGIEDQNLTDETQAIMEGPASRS